VHTLKTGEKPNTVSRFIKLTHHSTAKLDTDKSVHDIHSFAR